MELRSAEEEMSGLLVQYQSLRRTRLTNSDEDWMALLPETSSNVEESIDEKQATAHEVLVALETLRERVRTLEPKAARFRKRLGETDPITNNPRYGEKTMPRVMAFLETYDEISDAIRVVFGEKTDDEPSSVEDGSQHEHAIVHEMRRSVEEEQEAMRKEEQEKEKGRKKEEADRRAEQERAQEDERRREESSRVERLREEQELARRAEEARQSRLAAEQAQLEAQRREREDRERVDREWMAGITKGVDGVRQQLVVLKESTASEPGAHETALTALQALFSQIVAHPEEVKFRRVRRDHPRFNEDIGRHRGGKELLIAAGFRLGAVDDIPCFISKEPSIENDMDGWSAWFDLLKATAEIIEEEMIK